MAIRQKDFLVVVGDRELVEAAAAGADVYTDLHKIVPGA